MYLMKKKSGGDKSLTNSYGLILLIISVIVKFYHLSQAYIKFGRVYLF